MHPESASKGVPALEEEYRQARRQALRYLRNGLLFLTVCFAIGEALQYVEVPFKRLLVEGASIAGWVALWRPMEMFLYDLPDLRKRKRAARRDAQAVAEPGAA